MQKKTVRILGQFVLFLLCFNLQRLSAQQISYKGIYIDTFDAIVGNTAKEDSLLHYLKDSSFNSIICYRMSSVISTTLSSSKNTALAAFLKKARTQYGIKNVLASSESYNTFKTIIAPYNRSRNDTLERFNYYYLEFEFWNSHSTQPVSSANNGYYCTTYLNPNGYSCDTSGAFLYYRKMLKSLDSLAMKDGIRSATYVGNPNQGQCKFIANTVDLLLCDNYTANLSSIFSNVKTRFSYFGSTSKTLQIVPIFASYSPGGNFMGDWLAKAPTGPHSEKGLYNYYFLPRYNAETGAWKSKLNLIGYQWYRYSGMPHNGNYSSGTFCTAPTSISTNSISSNSATINWSLASSSLSYLVYYRVAGNTIWQSPIASSGNSITLTNLSASTTYEYQLQSVCVSSNSSNSTTFSFTTLSASTCDTPTNLGASAITDSSAILTWNAVTGSLNYTIRYRKVGATAWNSAQVSTTNYMLRALAASSIYEYQLLANCSSGAGSYSSSYLFSTLAPPCNTPSGLTVSNITINSASIKWNSISGAIGYTIQYKITGTNIWNTTSSTSNSKTILALVSGTNYEFQIQTKCSSSNSSNFSTSTYFSTLINTCGIPSNVIANSATTNSFTINWNSSTAASSYKVQYRKLNSTSWTTVSTNYNYKNIGSLSSGTIYEFAVAMQCSSGLSAFSTIQTITTQTNTLVCNVPTGLFTTNVKLNSVTVNWIPVNGASSYKVQYRKMGSTTWQSKTTSFSNKNLTSLTANSTYEYQVQTICSNGTSAYSYMATFYTGITTVQARLADSSLTSIAVNRALQNNFSTQLISNDNSFTLFPNPAENGNIHARIKLQQKEVVTLKIYDMLGKLMYSGTIITDDTGFSESQLAIEQELTSGIYQVIANGLTQKLQCKLILK